MKNSPTQSLLFEDEALQCYKNNIKWLLAKNTTMKKLSKDSFSKPGNKVLSNTNQNTVEINSQFDKTELDTEIAKWNQSNNGSFNVTNNVPNFNQLYQAYQQPNNSAQSQLNTIISNEQKYNNWKEITVENTSQIENELEKQQRKETIMRQ